MKKLLTVVAIGLLFTATATCYMGRTLSQQAFDQQVAGLKQLTPLTRLRLQGATLEHSLFGGRATIELSLPSAEAGSTALLVLESDLQYGPLLKTPQGFTVGMASGQSRLSARGLSDDTAQQLEALISPYLMTAQHRLNFSQQLLIDINIPPIEFAEHGQQLSFSGIQAQLIGHIDTRQAEGNLTIGSFQFNNPKGSIHTAAAQGRLAYANINDPLAPARFDINFPEINLLQSNGGITFKGLGIRIEQQLDNGLLNISETLQVAQIIAPLPVTAASATFEIKQINPLGVTLWTDMLGQTDTHDPATGLPEITEQQFRQLVSALLQPGLQFNQRYDIDALDGNLLADLDIEYVGLPNDLHPLDVSHPRQLIQAISAKLRLEADQQVAMALPIAPALPQYIEQGLVTQELQKLIVNAKLSNGELTVNGQPIPLDALLPEQIAQN